MVTSAICQTIPWIVTTEANPRFVVVSKPVDFTFNWRWDKDPEGLGVFGKVNMYVLSDPDRDP